MSFVGRKRVLVNARLLKARRQLDVTHEFQRAGALNGQILDADGKVDGIITDPGAPGHMPLSIVGLAPDMPQGFWF